MMSHSSTYSERSSGEREAENHKGLSKFWSLLQTHIFALAHYNPILLLLLSSNCTQKPPKKISNVCSMIPTKIM